MNVEKKVPEIRFKGFSEEWTEAALSDVIDVRSGKDYKHLGKGNIPVYGTGGYMLSVDSALSNVEDAIGIGRKGTIDKPYLLRSPFWTVDTLFYAVPKPRFKLDYLYCIFQKVDWKKHDESTGVPSLSKVAINNIPIRVTAEEEQAAIGNYFQKLDSLINQHQQKHDQLSNIKKAMLEKMFPKQGEAVPEIRFKDFSGEWEFLPFGACFANIPNNTLSRANLNYEDGIAKNIHYGDVLIKFGEVLDAGNEVLPFITNAEVVNKLKHAALRDGDIIIADAAEDSTVGKCTELFNIGEQLILSGLHTIAVRPVLLFSSKYLGYYLNSHSYHGQLLPLMQGTKVLSISKTALKNTHLVFPKCLKEQTAIGNYFQKLDGLINQHQQQITKLTNIKQACLSKMFV